MEINKAKFNKVVEAAKAKTNDRRWLNAIERAAKAILSGEMIVTTLAHGPLATTANGTYAANGHCNCEAARRGHTQCYHRAAARLMDIFETAPEAVSFADEVATSSRVNLIAEIENIWPRVEPHTPLASALMARFGKSDLSMLDDDMLRRVRLAIAMSRIWRLPMNDTATLKVTPITDKQPQPACRFTISATLRGFPIVIEGEGRAGDLKTIVDRLLAAGAEPPQTQSPGHDVSVKKTAPLC